MAYIDPTTGIELPPALPSEENHYCCLDGVNHTALSRLLDQETSVLAYRKKHKRELG
jgi:hypothetical protein